jgi:hypothetical protein
MADASVSLFDEHKVKSGETLSAVALKYGWSWQELARFNWGTVNPTEINRCLSAFVGCTKRDAADRNFVFDDSDEPGILFIPKKRVELELPTNQSHTVRIKRLPQHGPIEIQTVDEWGHRVPDVQLLLKSESQLPDVQLKTDAQGYGLQKAVPAGRYRVLTADGRPTYYHRPFGDGRPSRQGQSEAVEAVVDSRNVATTLTRVVVVDSAEQLEPTSEQRAYEQVYARSISGAEVTPPAGDSDGSKQVRLYCADNLAIAAGWTEGGKGIDVPTLVGKVLRDWLKDRHPTAISRGYYVLVLEPDASELTLVNQRGQAESLFKVKESVQFQAPVGAYALFEDVSTNPFVDMATQSHVIHVPSSDLGPQLEEVVTEPARFIEACNGHGRQLPIIYYLPPSDLLMGMTMYGGTGRLEDYGRYGDVNERIHKRNLAVCDSIVFVYRRYLKEYIERVKKTQDEDELRKLGPPRCPFEMPRPIGSSDGQYMDLLKAVSAANELRAWETIAHQLDKFYGRKAQGYPFLRIKPKFRIDHELARKLSKFLRMDLPKISPKAVGYVDYEYQIDLQVIDGDIQTITKSNVSLNGSVKMGSSTTQSTEKGFPIEFSLEQDPEASDKYAFEVKLGKFTIATDTSGKASLSTKGPWPGTFGAEFSNRTGEFGVSATLSGSALASRLRTLELDSPEKIKYANRLAEFIEHVDLQVMVGFAGTTEETILAVTSYAPGFFERRSLKELLAPSTVWNTLSTVEQASLAALGWDSPLWDLKYSLEKILPNSCRLTVDELSNAEKVAIVSLGFYRHEDYKIMIEKSVQQHSK